VYAANQKIGYEIYNFIRIHMKYEDLDKDTQGMIEAMCRNTGKTKAEAISVLIDLGSLSMMAAVCLERQREIMEAAYSAVNKDPMLKRTAEVYKAWTYIL